MSNETWMHIGLHGHSVGTFIIEPNNGIRWKSAMNTANDADDADDITLTRFIPKDIITSAKWTIFGPSAHLRISTNVEAGNNSRTPSELRFDGFPPADYEKLSNALNPLITPISMQKHTMGSSGASFGLTNISQKHLTFRSCILEDADEEGEEFEPRDGDEMFSMNLKDVAQCVMQGNTRNEIELQFHESDTVEAGTDQLVSIRFYVPPDLENDEQDDDNKDHETPAEILQQRILSVADIKNTAGNEIIQFTEKQGTFLTPRGRYKITLYDSHLRMYGNRYDYKIKYEDISRLFLLPRPDDVHMAFVIALDKPIRQGQQRYQILVLHTTKEQEEIQVNLDAKTLESEYKGELQPIMRGLLCNLIAKSFKCIAKKKVFISGKFANAYQQACVKCALRANEGHLYPLEKCFVFIHKPPVIIRFNEVESVEFQRYAGGQGSTRNFDLCVTLTQSAGDATASSSNKEYIFSGIDRSDYAGLYNFLSGKNIKIKNLQEAEEGAPNSAIQAAQNMMLDPDDDDDESEDEDFEEGGSSSSSEDDGDDEDGGGDDGSSIDSDLAEARKNAKKKDKDKDKEGNKRPAKSSSKSSSSKKQKTATKAATKPKKKKAKKDPNAPKKPKTAFIYFGEKMRPKLKEKNPEASFGELSKLVGSAFKALTPDEKQKYDESALKDKARYKAEMENYTPPSDDSDDSDLDSDDGNKKPPAKKKKKKDPNAPKRGGNAYMFFVKSMRSKIQTENPDAAFGDLQKIVGARFKALSAEEKGKYEKMAEEDKKRYAREMENYTPPPGDDDAPSKSSKVVKKGKKVKASTSSSSSSKKVAKASKASKPAPTPPSDDSSSASGFSSDSDSGSGSDSD